VHGVVGTGRPGATDRVEHHLHVAAATPAAAFTLDGLSAEHECQLTILTVEKLIRDYMYQAQSAELFWHDYEKIDEELYCRMLGVERKMTQMEYMSLSNPCPYCEGNCPNDPEHMCDEFSSQTQE
jgi:hypothetical protein